MAITRNFLAGQFLMLFCLFHAVLIMIPSPQNLKTKHHKKFPSFELSFFAPYIKMITRDFSDYGPIKLQVTAIQQIMKDLSQTFSKL